MVTTRIDELNQYVSREELKRSTAAVGILEYTNGQRIIAIGTSNESGLVGQGFKLGPQEVLVRGLLHDHAEADIIAYTQARGLKVVSIGATRDICDMSPPSPQPAIWSAAWHSS